MPVLLAEETYAIPWPLAVAIAGPLVTAIGVLWARDQAREKRNEERADKREDVFIQRLVENTNAMNDVTELFRK